MPVEIVDLDWEYAKNIDVNQVWAQAYHLYRSGVSWKLTDNEKTVHLAICEHYEVEDVLEGHLREWFKIEPQNENLFTRTTAIIHHLKTYAGVSGRDRALTMQVAATLNKLGLRKGRKEHNRGYIGIEAGGHTEPLSRRPADQPTYCIDLYGVVCVKHCYATPNMAFYNKYCNGLHHTTLPEAYTTKGWQVGRIAKITLENRLPTYRKRLAIGWQRLAAQCQPTVNQVGRLADIVYHWENQNKNVSTCQPANLVL
ncbi:MAG: hypothetical protein R2867_19785 [Caldilineaceae bacterium]